MKKTFFIVCLTTFIFAAYSAQGMINPWVDCEDDIRCGEQKAGFDFPIRVKNYTVRAMKGMIEVHFSMGDGRKVVARKALYFDADANEDGIIDISGDYNHYPIDKTIILSNGSKFSVRGEDNNYKVVNFTSVGGHYSIVCNEGLSLSDVVYLYNFIAEEENLKNKL